MGNEKEALYHNTYGHLLKPLSGLYLFLEQLKEKNIPSGIATMGNQNNLDMTLKQLNIVAYFNSTTCGDPKECIAFEDTQPGITAAQAAGMKVVGVATQFSEKKLLKLRCIVSVKDFQNIFVK